MIRIVMIAMAAGLVGNGQPADIPIRLSAMLDRPAGVYAVGDPISLSVFVERDAALRVWLRDPSGKIVPVIPPTAGGEPLHLRGGERVRLPRTGAFRITPPTGRYEFLLTATTAAPGKRSLTDADSRLAGRAAREQRTIAFLVEGL